MTSLAMMSTRKCCKIDHGHTYTNAISHIQMKRIDASIDIFTFSRIEIVTMHLSSFAFSMRAYILYRLSEWELLWLFFSLFARLPPVCGMVTKSTALETVNSRWWWRRRNVDNDCDDVNSFYVSHFKAHHTQPDSLHVARCSFDALQNVMNVLWINRIASHRE